MYLLSQNKISSTKLLLTFRIVATKRKTISHMFN
jgi:hypothetical protein